MRSVLGVVGIIAFIVCSCARFPNAFKTKPPLSGEEAMEYVRAQVEFGPRPPGSPQLQKCREFIEREMRSFGYRIEEDTFNAQTPYGPIQMSNLIARKGSGGKGVIALASHYDTKLMHGFDFVGANDPGSSAGLLLELAKVLADGRNSFDYWFLFLDGEEAFVEWSTFDSTYGSRHLAGRWKREGVARANEVLASGAAQRTLEQLIQVTRAAG